VYDNASLQELCNSFIAYVWISAINEATIQDFSCIASLLQLHRLHCKFALICRLSGFDDIN